MNNWRDLTETQLKQLGAGSSSSQGKGRQPSTGSGRFDPFLALLEASGLPRPALEYKFVPGRQFKADYAWPDRKVIVEKNGGVWKSGASGHSSGTGILRDYEKANLANAAGWCYLTFTPKQLNKGECLDLLRVLLG